MNRLGPLRDGRRRLSFDVGDAQAAADAAARADRFSIDERAEGGDLLDEGRGFEDLAADVRVNSDELAAPPSRVRAFTASAAAPDARENPNFVSSCPVFTNSWVWASIPGRDPDQNRRRRAARGLDAQACGAARRSQAVDLVEGVDDDAADSGTEGGCELLGGLVVAVEHELFASRAAPRGPTCISPPVETSSAMFSSMASAAMALHKKALVA